MKIISLLFISILSASFSLASGPKQLAKANRSLWPYLMSNASEFDFASKMEMLVFVNIFQTYEKMTDQDSIKNHLGLKKVSIASIEVWRDQIRKILLSNFNALQTTSAHDFIEIPKPLTWQKISDVANTLEIKIPRNLKLWFDNANDFYNIYMYEQMRLAALFPRISSEILTLQESEVTGTNYGDKQFLLTFDDGPTLAGGNTDRLISTLNANNVNGIFFVLGDRLHARLKAGSVQKIQKLYSPMFMGSHGKVHKAHPCYDDWQFSLSFTNHLIETIDPENKSIRYFRPPYGQRNDKIIDYLSRNNRHVMLWNIDSQDWSSKISSKEVADRVISLMLLWRKGVLLFHDIHPKVNIALPLILDQFKYCNLNWIDAKQLD